MTHTTALALFDAGYADLVSVIPPGARISAASAIDASQCGKVPGRKNRLSTWGGYDWRTYVVKRGDALSWDISKANIGLRAANYPAVDIDTMDEALALHVERRALELLGPAPVRIGRAPKRLLMYRTAEPFGRMRLWLTDEAGAAHLVEVLGDGQQYVVAGTHPATGKAYEWSQELPAPTELSSIDADQARAFLLALEEDADLLGLRVEREGSGRDQVDRAGVEQTALRAPSLEHVRRVVEQLPNTNEAFPGRDDYLRIGYAIKAAGGEDAFDIYADWAARWEGNDRALDNDPEVVASDWARMVPPFQVGWWHLLGQVTRLVPEFNAAGEEFEASGDPADAPSYQPPTPPTKTQPGPSSQAAGASSAVAYSDTAVANKMFQAYGPELRYCRKLGGWLVWDGGRWAEDERGLSGTWAVEVANAEAHKALADQSIQSPSTRNAKAMRLCSAGTIDSVLSALKRRQDVATVFDAFDADPMALNTPGGLIDLGTGELMPGAEQRPLVTKRTAVSPAPGEAPLWRAFLEQTTNGDAELQRYLQILAGYCLTGRTDEQILVFVWGRGGNGKSVFLSTLTGILGDYAVSSPSEVFAESKGDRHPTELARMRGARLVSASETQEGRALDEAKIKKLTGGDKVEARFMQQDFFDFVPQFKLIMVGNHKPAIRNLDAAMERRLHLVPFTHTPEVVDPHLLDKLRAEWPQILQWALEGCAAWQREGLIKPAVVREHTAEYLEDEDPVGTFLAERCVLSPQATCLSKALFEAWVAWAHDNNEFVGTHKAFSQKLLGKPGVTRWRDKLAGRRGMRGLELIYQEGEFEAQAAPERAKA